MPYALKKGVALYMSEEIEKILEIICPIFDAFYIPVVITSGLDGPHRENSLHGKFRAIDLRKNFDRPGLSGSWSIHRKAIISCIEQKIKFHDYPIKFLEEEDHLHIEWFER
jgi:hypothetical protein